MAKERGQLDDLPVGDAAVEEVLGDAEVRVEEGGGETGVGEGPPELDPEALEPLATLVGDHPLQRDEVDVAERVVGREERLAGPDRVVPRPVDVTAEVGEVAPGQHDRPVGLVIEQLQPGEG